jgi:hypothetical protein
MRAALLVIGLLCGCKSKEQPHGVLARVEAMKPKLAKVRHLPFKSEVSAAQQSTEDFRAYMRREVAKEGASLAGKSEALVALGLLPPSTDLGSAIENAYATQAAAYYDPALKRFFLVMTPSEDMFDITVAHELTHALQDQHFDLPAYLRAAESSDARTARHFVVEGDAMLAAIAYLVYNKTNLAELTPDQVKAMRPKLEQLAAADPSQTAAAMKQQMGATAHMDPQLRKSLDALDTIPRTVMVPFLDAYMKGALLALEAYDRGGWAAVDALYKEPPESTEQVLHPKDKLLAHLDRPTRVTLPKLDGYSVVASDVLGELQWGIYFSLWKHEGDGHVQQNWDGDRFVVVKNPDGKVVSLIATVWESPYDALQFYAAYVSTVQARYGGKTTAKGDGTFVEHGDDATWIIRIDEHVFIVDGGLDDKLVDVLVDDTTFERY